MLKNLISPFNKAWQFFLAMLIAGMIINIVFFSDPKGSIKIFALQTVWSSTIFITQWLGHAIIQTMIGRKFNWLEYPFTRTVLTLFSVVFYAIFAYLLVQSILNYLVFGEWPVHMWTSELSSWYIPISISFIVSLFVATYGFFSSWKNSVLEKERIQNEMLTYKYEALRNQINPHFMFNSLNVLSELVYDDQKLAVKFIHHFSDIYRYVLDSREKELVPLEEELEFVEKFIFLLTIRFDEKLKVNINIPANTNKHIVPLAIQLLIENAVKHNEVSKANPLRIDVEIKEEYLLIKNPIHLKNVGDQSKKIGLKNLKQQIAYFTDQELVISESDHMFSVKLPLITLES